MPDQNPTDPQNQIQSSIADTGATAPPIPTPAPFSEPPAALPLDVPPPPPIIETGEDSGSAAPAPGEPEEMPKKKFGRGKVIATILGILILVGGLGAGLFLVGQQVIFKQKAAMEEPCNVCANNKCTEVASPPDCSHSLDECSNPGGTCKGAPKTDCDDKGGTCKAHCSADSEDASGTLQCGSNWCCVPKSTDCSSAGGTCKDHCSADSEIASRRSECGSNWCCVPKTPTCTESCQPDHLDPNGYCGSTDNQYWCQKVIGDYGVLKSCYGTCRDPYTYSSGDYCLDTQHGRNCDAGVRCSTSPDPRCPGGTSTLTGTTTITAGPSAQCFAVKAYNTNWTELTAAQLSALTAGDKVRFVVGGTASSGSFDKAVFKINGAETGEITDKQPGTDNFFYEYTIPAGLTTFTVDAKIHHTSLGWSNY